MSSYGIRKELRSVPFDAVLQRIPEALKAEGFGVLTEVDIADTLKQKIGVDFPRYRILGACNPVLAHQALQLERDVGLMMPCNVVVYEQEGATVVTAVDPTRTMAASGNEAVRAVAVQVRDKLARALDRLTA